MTRADALDILRCLAIAGMVFSGQLVWMHGLPAWMYHAQLPPPSFAFQPQIAGLTWVDLVFPFFIFSMGAAIPLSLRGKLEKGISTLCISGNLVKRGLLLVFFAVVLGNTGFYRLSPYLGETLSAVAAILTWLLFTAMFTKFPRADARTNNIINICGGVLLAGSLLLYRYCFGVPVSIFSHDAIIHILATLALAGGFLWMWTKDDIKLRLYLTALFAAIRVSIASGGWLAGVAEMVIIPWLWSPAYLDYLCILLPATIAGDIIWKWMKKDDGGFNGITAAEATAAFLMTATLVFTLWAMYTRRTGVGAAFALVSGAVILFILKRSCADGTGMLHYRIASIGFMLLAAGLILEPFEGGIRKDGPTLGYLFVTGGLAAYCLAAISIPATRTHAKTGFLQMAGKNPMVAYTAAGYLILPLISLAGISGGLVWLGSRGGWGVMLKATIITLSALAITWTLTKKKIYWKT